MALINSWREELYILFSFLWWSKMSITWASLSSRSEEIIRIKKVINTPPFSHLQRLTTLNILHHSLLQFLTKRIYFFKGGIQMSTQNLFITFFLEIEGKYMCKGWKQTSKQKISQNALTLICCWTHAASCADLKQIYNQFTTIPVRKQSCSSNLPVQINGFPAYKPVNWEPNLSSLRIIETISKDESKAKRLDWKALRLKFGHACFYQLAR